MLIWWQGEAARAGADHGVVRAADVAVLREVATVRRDAAERADELLADARAQAEQILADARAEAEALLTQAQARIEAACEAGRAEGERQAALAWHERQADQAVDQAKVVRGLHERLADVVTSAVERIVQTEGRAALYQRALKSVQSLSRSATALTLRVSTADFEAARDGIAAVPDLQAAGLTVEVVVDPALPSGSCLFESDIGVVDASLTTQLDALRAAMSRAVRRAVAE
ncbi:type III secretion system stator protein SctL [Roseateles amylovorans]|uniref:Type 3 secretion system stator protein n=1 Tax=Roseateles amylovorans TaxID=2978473 RepID=A0ABY6AYM8_9BURK|nr:type III secretion system stator protein SctL [Roseateles amylovorans]UXH78286.1 type III secretion system stator protein SctL [Roseateles amylovorans]